MRHFNSGLRKIENSVLPRAKPTGRGGALAAVLALLGTAIVANQVIAARSERLHPPKGKFITIDGVRLHYIERGSGRPIVLIHGNGTMADELEVSGLLERLSHHFYVIAIDRPGCGYSERPRDRLWTLAAQTAVITKAIKSLNIHQPLVIGHSWGTLVALSMALDASLHVSGVVVISGYYFPTVRSDVASGSWPAVPILGDLMRYTISPLIGWLLAAPVFKKIFSPAAVTPAFQEKFETALSLRPSQIRATAADTAQMIPSAASLCKNYHGLTMPLLILAGANDEIVDTEKQARELHREIEGSSLIVFDHDGHMLHHSATESVSTAILDKFAVRS